MYGNAAETRFIRLCVSEDGRSERDGAAAEVRDWDELVALAAQHRVAAYVQEATAQLRLVLPPSAHARLRSLTLVARARAMLIDRLLAQLAGACADRAISVVVLKGPALARTVYPHPALRTYDDLDLLVQAQDERSAAAMLLARGFEELPDAAEAAWRARAGWIEGGAPFHRRFAEPATPAMVELHVDPLQLGLTPACEADRWRRALPLSGVPGALLLSPEDQLIQLSVHAQKHGYSRLIWLKDIDLLLRAHEGGMDWPLVTEVAKREGVTAAVWYAIELTAALLGTPVPEACRRRLRPSPLIRVLYRHIWPLEAVAALRGQMHRRAVQFRAADAWRGSIPSLVLMGRRGARARAGFRATARRLLPGRAPVGG